MWGSLSKLLLVVAMTGIMTQSLGQTPQQPVVNADHSVTFTVKAPGTKKMVLVLSEKKYKMQRHDDTFTYQTAPLVGRRRNLVGRLRPRLPDHRQYASSGQHKAHDCGYA